MYGKVSMTFRRMLRRFLQYTSILFVDVEKQKQKHICSPRGAAKSAPELTLTGRKKNDFSPRGTGESNNETRLGSRKSTGKYGCIDFLLVCYGGF